MCNNDKVSMCYNHNSNSGFKLGPDSREKCFLPPVILGRSDSEIGRSYKITAFSVSLEAN